VPQVARETLRQFLAHASFEAGGIAAGRAGTPSRKLGYERGEAVEPRAGTLRPRYWLSERHARSRAHIQLPCPGCIGGISPSLLLPGPVPVPQNYLLDVRMRLTLRPSLGGPPAAVRGKLSVSQRFQSKRATRALGLTPSRVACQAWRARPQRHPGIRDDFQLQELP